MLGVALEMGTKWTCPNSYKHHAHRRGQVPNSWMRAGRGRWRHSTLCWGRADRCSPGHRSAPRAGPSGTQRFPLMGKRKRKNRSDLVQCSAVAAEAGSSLRSRRGGKSSLTLCCNELSCKVWSSLVPCWCHFHKHKGFGVMSYPFI